MVTVTHLDDNIVQVKIESSLTVEDFSKIASVADDLIKKHETIRLLINAVDFQGWENFTSAENHFKFVKEHHQKVVKIAFVAGHMWQHWVAAMASIFVHPEIKVFDQDKIDEAEAWIRKS